MNYSEETRKFIEEVKAGKHVAPVQSSRKKVGCSSFVAKVIFIIILSLLVNNAFSMPIPDFSHFPNHVCEYLTENYINAKRVEHLYGVPCAISLGVSCFESGYGRSKIANQINNVFGMKLNGGEYRVYDSFSASFDDFGELMNNDRYSPILDVDLRDLLTWCETLQMLGYNPNKTYPQRLYAVIRYINKKDQL